MSSGTEAGLDMAQLTELAGQRQAGARAALAPTPLSGPGQALCPLWAHVLTCKGKSKTTRAGTRGRLVQESGSVSHPGLEDPQLAHAEGPEGRGQAGLGPPPTRLLTRCRTPAWPPCPAAARRPHLLTGLTRTRFHGAEARQALSPGSFTGKPKAPRPAWLQNPGLRESSLGTGELGGRYCQ